MLSEAFRRPFNGSIYEGSRTVPTSNHSVYFKNEQRKFLGHSEPNQNSFGSLTDLQNTTANHMNSLFDNLEPPANLVDSFYSCAALETRRIDQLNEHEEKTPPTPQGRPLHGFGLADLATDMALQNYASIDLQEMLMSLIYNRFIPHSVLWPGTNFALSQIREWPTSYESSWSSSKQSNDGEALQTDTSIWTIRNEPNIWSGASVTNSSRSSTSTKSLNYPNAVNEERGDNVCLPQHNNFHSNQEFIGGHFLTTKVKATLEVPPIDHIDEMAPWIGNGAYNDESETRINQMVAELSVSGVAPRRLPKREEDIKKLQHFRTLKEKGKGGKSNIQLPSRPVR